MLFNRSLPTPSITTLDGSDLKYVDNYKYLGVRLDCKLSFQTHIKHLQSKIASNTLLSKLDAVYHSVIRFVTKSPYTQDVRL